MSLTSCLKDTATPIAQFLAGQLPAVAALAGDYRSRLPLRPDTVRPHGPGPFNYRNLGQAIDLRLRVAFGTPIGSPLKAGIALATLDIAQTSTRRLAVTVSKAGQELLALLREHQAATAGALVLDKEAEERLARLCFVASYFEEVFRQGLRPGNPLLQADPQRGLSGLLERVPDYVSGDISRQAARADQRDTLQWVLGLPEGDRMCGPTFAGSGHVGGADADFIAAGHLIDCKATIHPQRLGRAELYQLAGYLLLDYDDAFGIERLSLYLSRQGKLIGWDAEEFLKLMGARQSLPQLRAACRQALTAPPGTGPSPVPRQVIPYEQHALFDAM
ncbi:hypothetical protein [Streptomyces flavidovirens]